MTGPNSQSSVHPSLLWGGLVSSIGLVIWVFSFFASDRFSPHAPDVSFSDVAEASQLDFVHNNGAVGEGLLPETMGSGVAFLDFDNDGDQDLFFVNSTYWPWELEAGLEPGRAALYRNDGDGRFVEIAEAMGIEPGLYGMGVAVGDYDNDGWQDLFISALGKDRLYRNLNGNRFVNTTLQAGVEGEENEWSTSAAWVDVDRDGLLDLFVCNYVRWAKELGLERAFKLAGIGRGYGGPQVNFTGSFPYLYLNNGDGTFREVSEAFGLRFYDDETGLPLLRTLAVAPVDVDQDGWMDFVLANNGVRNFVLRNQLGAGFEEIGEGFEGVETGGAGIDAALMGGGSSLGVLAGSFANEFSRVYLSVGNDLLFGDRQMEAQVSGAKRFGVFFFDYDLDGRQDLLAVNGYLEEQINRVEAGIDFRREAQLFWNAGPNVSNRFLAVGKQQAGEDLFRPAVGRGAAFGDLNGDGALDVVISQNGGKALALRNEEPTRSNNSWLRIKLVGTQSNRDAIGASVSVKVGNRLVVGRVMPTRSYLSQSELPITLGLGRSWRVRDLTVSWPSGLVETVQVDSLDQTMTIVEGSGTAVTR